MGSCVQCEPRNQTQGLIGTYRSGQQFRGVSKSWTNADRAEKFRLIAEFGVGGFEEKRGGWPPPRIIAGSDHSQTLAKQVGTGKAGSAGAFQGFHILFFETDRGGIRRAIRLTYRTLRIASGPPPQQRKVAIIDVTLSLRIRGWRVRKSAMELSEFVYTVLLKPRPLRLLANSTLRAISPKRKLLGDAWWTPNPNDPVVSGAAALGVYEKPETAFFKEACQPNMTFVDIGANSGYYSAWALSLLKGQGRIVAIEPDPEALLYLSSTRDANNSGIMSVMPYAASSQEGKHVLFRNRDNRGDNRLYENELCQDQATIECRTVDSILSDLGITSVDLVKIDVQGYEGHVLQGMKETLGRSPKVTLLVEFWPWGLSKAGSDAAGLLDFLAEIGFALFELKGDGLLRMVGRHSDLIERLTGRRYTNLVGILRRGAGQPIPARKAMAAGA